MMSSDVRCFHYSPLLSVVSPLALLMYLWLDSCGYLTPGALGTLFDFCLILFVRVLKYVLAAIH